MTFPRLARGRVARWPRERIEALSTDEVEALRKNAERLHEPEVAAVCDEVLRSRPSRGPGTQS